MINGFDVLIGKKKDVDLISTKRFEKYSKQKTLKLYVLS